MTNPLASITFNSQKLQAFPVKIGNKTRVPTLTSLIQHSTGSNSNSNQIEKRNKMQPNWKGRSKTVFICRWHNTVHRETPIQKNRCTPMFIAAQFTIAKCWKQPTCSSVNEWIKKLWCIYTMQYYTAERKKELLPFATTWMELESIMLKQNKPGGERQIPYDLTFNRNLINETNKQAKYNQKHWNKEQTDSNQSGEGRG